MPHHSPLTRYRAGEYTRATRAAHAESVRDWRRDLVDAEIGPEIRAELLARIRAAGAVTEPARDMGLTHQQVYGLARWDADFAAALDAALAVHCSGGEVCGRPAGYKRRGRCAKCRAAHAAGRRRTHTP